MSSFISITGNLRKKSPLAFFMMVHTVIFLLLFVVLEQLFYYAPGVLELNTARQVLGGKIPYRDFMSEYPPLGLLSFVLPALIFRRNPAYAFAFAVEMLLFDFLILKLLVILASCLKTSIQRVLVIYTIFVLAVGPIIICRYDILPAALTLAAVTAFVTERRALAFALVALGITAKIYPAVIAPLMGLYLLKNFNVKRLIGSGVSFLTTIAIFNLPFYLVSPENFLGILTYHAKRGLHSESVYASVLLLGKILGITNLKGVFDYGSWNISSPIADTLARLSFPITAILLLVLYVVYAIKLWKSPGSNVMSPENAREFITFSALSIAIFIVSGKVFSPQYLIWLIPLITLTGSKWTNLTWFIFAVIGILTQFIYPYNYVNFEMFLAPYVLVIIFRNVLSITLTILTAISGRNANSKLKPLAPPNSRL